MTKRILCTGSSGFIGTTFCERFGGMEEYRRKLNDPAGLGWDLHGLDLVPPKERFPAVAYHICDITDRTEVMRTVLDIQPDLIIHFAAQARVEPSYADPIGTYRVNVQGTINLLEAALRLSRALPGHFDRFVYASSEIIYGPADRYPTKEMDHFRPTQAYAASKVAADVMVQNAHGLRTVVLRSGMGFGPRSSPKEQIVAKFLWKCLHDEDLLFPMGVEHRLHPTRDINFVGNFVEGVGQIVESGVTGVYNLASGRETNLEDLAQKCIMAVEGTKSRVLPSDRFEYRPGEVGYRTWLDITKAREDFGYYPKVSLEAGLPVTALWLRQNGNTYWG